MAPSAIPQTSISNGNHQTEFSKASLANGARETSQNGIHRDLIDVDVIYKNFPQVGGQTIPFNNANGTAIYKGAADSAYQWMTSLCSDYSDDDPATIAANVRREKQWEELADFLNCSPDEITFGQSTTALFRCLARSMKSFLNSNSEIVCSNMCHEASAGAWVSLAKELGITIKWWAPPRDEGDNPRLAIETLKPLLSPKTRLVTCNHVSNVIGTINPIRAIADEVHKIPGALLAVDGVAWAPHRPVDVKALDVDFYCISWYKVFGPHMSQLYARKRTQDTAMTSINHYFLPPTTLDDKLRLGTPAYEQEEMLAPIARYLKHEVTWSTIIDQETLLTRIMLDYLLSRPDKFRVFGEPTCDPEKRVSIVIFEVLGRRPSQVSMQIHTKNRFRLLWGDCWAPRPVFEVLKPQSDEGIVRVSFVHYNTVAEVEEFCRDLDALVNDEEPVDATVGEEGFADGYAAAATTNTTHVETTAIRGVS